MTALAFQLPQALEATAPAEARGLERDEVRLMVADRTGGRIEHAQFRDLPRFLAAGDLLVVNTSATLPAALPAVREDGTEQLLHVATQAPQMPGDRWWVVELRDARHLRPGERVDVGAGATFELAAPYAGGTRLWLARFDGDTSLPDHLARRGRPIRYSYVTERWPLEAYQTAFALQPGSAEMPSAGRPFTPDRVNGRLRLRAPAGRSPRRSSRGSWREGSSSRRSCSTQACPRPSATSRHTLSATRCRRPRRASSTTSAPTAGA